MPRELPYEAVIHEGPPHSQAWDSRLNEFCDARPEQTGSYGAAMWGARRLSQLALKQGEKTAAMAQAAIFKLQALPWGVAYVKFGPVWRRTGHPESRDTLRAILRALVQEYAERRGLHLVVMPQPDIQHDKVMREELEASGLVNRRALRDPKRYLVDLEVGEEQLYRGLDQKWRYNLKRAERNDLTVHCGSGDAADYLQIHEEMSERKRRNSASALVLPRLNDSLPEELRPRIVFASRDAKPVAGAVILELGDTATYLFGATSSAGRETKAGYALHWWIARWLRGRGIRWYDLGGEAGEPGLRQFKKGLVGRTGRVHNLLGHYERGSRPVSALAATLLLGARESRLMSVLRNQMLRVTGSVRAWLCVAVLAA